MYSKMKYLFYLVLALILTFMVMLLINQSQQAENKKRQQQEELEFVRKTEALTQSTLNSEGEPDYYSDIVQQDNKRTKNSVVNDNIKVVDIKQNKPENQDEPLQEEQEEKEKFYIIQSDKFNTINTQKDKFGLIAYNSDNTAIAQSLNKSNILLYVIDAQDKVVWQKKLSNKAGRTIKPVELILEDKNISLKINDKDSVYETVQEISFGEDRTPEYEWDMTLVKNESSRPLFYNSSNVISNLYEGVQRFIVNEKEFYVIAYKNPNTTKYSQTISRKFYIYRNDNGILKRVYYLFDRTEKKDVNVYELVDYQVNPKNVLVGYNGKVAGYKDIPVSLLLNPYTKAAGENLRPAPTAEIYDSNIDIKVTPQSGTLQSGN